MRNSHHIAKDTGVRTWRMSFAIAALTLGMSGTALANPSWFERGHGGYGHRYCPEARPVVVERYYYRAPRRVYYAPPAVVYVPPQTYYYQAPAYQQTYAPPAGYPGYGYSSGGYGGGERVLSSAVLGAAGGFLGSQVGHGSGRAAATAAGAVAGWVLGSRIGQ